MFTWCRQFISTQYRVVPLILLCYWNCIAVTVISRWYIIFQTIDFPLKTDSIIFHQRAPFHVLCRCLGGTNHFLSQVVGITFVSMRIRCVCSDTRLPLVISLVILFLTNFHTGNYLQMEWSLVLDDIIIVLLKPRCSTLECCFKAQWRSWHSEVAEMLRHLRLKCTEYNIVILIEESAYLLEINLFYQRSCFRFREHVKQWYITLMFIRKLYKCKTNEYNLVGYNR